MALACELQINRCTWLTYDIACSSHNNPGIIIAADMLMDWIPTCSS